jgi:hypothetical protein
MLNSSSPSAQAAARFRDKVRPPPAPPSRDRRPPCRSLDGAAPHHAHSASLFPLLVAWVVLQIGFLDLWFQHNPPTSSKLATQVYK